MSPKGRRGTLKSRVTYRGNWKGLGKMYDVLVSANDYTSIVITDGENLSEKVNETLKKFGLLTDR